MELTLQITEEISLKYTDSWLLWKKSEHPTTPQPHSFLYSNNQLDSFQDSSHIWLHLSKHEPSFTMQFFSLTFQVSHSHSRLKTTILDQAAAEPFYRHGMFYWVTMTTAWLARATSGRWNKNSLGLCVSCPALFSPYITYCPLQTPEFKNLVCHMLLSFCVVWWCFEKIPT